MKAEGHLSLDELLLSGGDARLALDPTSGLNIYGCSPRPRKHIDDFSSSTASTISENAYCRAERSRRLLEKKGINGFDDLAEEARLELRGYLGLHDREAEIIFSPSGTDTQLLALFLVRATLGKPLTSIVVGSDQTGGGTTHTAQGCQFIDGGTLKKGDAIEGLSEGVRSVSVPFCDPDGRPRTLAEIDGAVTGAVEVAIAGGSYVLLQTMASSKLGWTAPSHACVKYLRENWPSKIRVVVDACQMRIGLSRLRDNLARGHILLVTGSKFFCGPPFSGALIIPASMRSAIAATSDVPATLVTRSRKFGWPCRWDKLRTSFSDQPNIGQWLRWEAALEEMHAYYAVPGFFRRMALQRFAEAAPGIIAASPSLIPFNAAVHDAIPTLDGEFCTPTIFSFFAGHLKQAFSLAESIALYQALNRNFTPPILAASGTCARQSATCHSHVGPPVPMGCRDRAVLRISSSARLVTRCWSPDPVVAAARIEDEITKVQAVIEKVSLLAQYVDAAAA